MAANPNSRYRAESAMTGAPRLTSTASTTNETRQAPSWALNPEDELGEHGPGPRRVYEDRD
jgi:hypothetical protein